MVVEVQSDTEAKVVQKGGKWAKEERSLSSREVQSGEEGRRALEAHSSATGCGAVQVGEVWVRPKKIAPKRRSPGRGA